MILRSEYALLRRRRSIETNHIYNLDEVAADDEEIVWYPRHRPLQSLNKPVMVITAVTAAAAFENITKDISNLLINYHSPNDTEKKKRENGANQYNKDSVIQKS
ncbi:Hypothetical predicted protein [Octopus vulgaris]|uniref:Uncharacterized protein n=1 Tax=Octopus vulgaris TaxID=6645 RepID=A0AA36F760_OCTVU|nr:Hypothetical predicted protein [Octopus vulgaris]